MNRPPEPPPEGVLIESARGAAKLSVREAARRAGISEGWWRQVARGYQSLSGGAFGIVRDVPADTIARMARAAGVEPEQLAVEGQRPDAAEALRQMPQPGAPSGAAPDSPGGIYWPIPPDPRGPFTAEVLIAAAPYVPEISRRLAELRTAGRDRPAGAEMFPDDSRAEGSWDAVLAVGYPPEVAIQYAAAMYGEYARSRREHRDRSGTRGALVRT